MIPLYVATTESNALRAAESGLKKPFLLTDDLEIAIPQAERLAEKRGERPFILEVAADEEDLRIPKKVVAEPFAYVPHPWGARDEKHWEEMLKRGEVPLPESEEEWEKAIDIFSLVEHQGNVPPRQINAIPVGPR